MIIDLFSLNLDSVSNSGAFIGDPIDLVSLICWYSIDGRGIGSRLVDASRRIPTAIVCDLILFPLV